MLKNKASWSIYGALATVLGFAMVPETAYAASNGIEAYTTDTNAGAMTNNLITQICNIMTYVGAVVLVVGIIQVIMAFKNEDADGKTRGMLVAVTGIALIGIQGIVTAVVPQGHRS